MSTGKVLSSSARAAPITSPHLCMAVASSVDNAIDISVRLEPWLTAGRRGGAITALTHWRYYGAH